MPTGRTYHWLTGLTVLAMFPAFSTPASAQIQADLTLPTPTQVNGSSANCIVTTCTITGGTAAGSNLFHSFSQFSLSSGTRAIFENNNAAIQTIISRVTGGLPSSIDGQIAAGGLARNFNLILINPNGITFGNRASLNLGGSFIASTARSVLFADNSTFSAIAAPPPILSVSVPVGLQFGATAAPIQVLSGANLFVPVGKTLALVGGNLQLDAARLTAREGRLELGSVAPNSLVQMSAIPTGWVMGYAGVTAFQDVTLINGSNGAATGGNIQVRGRTVTLQGGSRLGVNASGNIPGGVLDVIASESVQLVGTDALGASSGLFAQTTGVRNAGTINVTTKDFFLADGARLYSQTFDNGNGGPITINASQSVVMNGVAGGVVGGVFSETIGNVLNPLATGLGGDITINTNYLAINGNISISTTTASAGRGGNILVNSSRVDLTGYDGSPRTIATETLNPLPGAGNGGNIKIVTNQLNIQNYAKITAASSGAGVAGGIQVHSNQVSLSNRGQITVSGTGSGVSGNIDINAGQLRMVNGSKIRAFTTLSNGGNIFLRLSDPVFSLWMENNTGNIAYGNEISAEAFGFANAGNLTIDAKGMILSWGLDPQGRLAITRGGNNDIVANAIFGRGGRIGATALLIRGFREFQGFRTPESDFTSLSFNLDFPGELSINTEDSPNEELPSDFPPKQVAQVCQPEASAEERSEFVVRGTGGIPTRPIDDVGMDEAIAVPLADPVTLSQPVSPQAKANTSPQPAIVEAQRAIQLADGTLKLIAPAVATGLPTPTCQTQ